MKQWLKYGLLCLCVVPCCMGQDVYATRMSTVRVHSTQLQGEIKVSVQEAIEAYQELFPEVTLTRIELDSKLGRYAYKLEGVDADSLYSIIVDAQTKEITKKGELPLELEERKGVKQKQEALDLSHLATLEEVTHLAQVKAPEGKAQEWALFAQSSGTCWIVKVVSETNEYTVKIQAQTHEVIEVSAKQ